MNQVPSCLDWIITDDPNILEELKYDVPLGKSDHVCLKWQLSFKKRCAKEELKLNYWKADYAAIREKLISTNWLEELEGKSVNDMWEKFSDIINTCVTSFVPLYRSTECKKKAPWMSKETKKLIKKRNRAWTAYARNKSTKLFEVYKRLRNDTVSSSRKDKAQYQKKLVKRMKNSPKMFYSYVRSKQKNVVTVSRVCTTDGKLSENDEETAQILSDQFQKVFAVHRNVDPVNLATDSPEELSASELFTVNSVYKKLCMLTVSKSPGPDNMHPHLLKNCADLLAFPLTYIFQRSFQDSCLPDDWRTATVIPIFKKGSKSDPGNYRPVSLTCVSCKIMESIIRDYIVEQLNNSESMSVCQHGFTKGRSCTTNLLTAFELWTKWIDEGYGVDIVYLDYKKAFDSVDHATLIKKLSSINIDYMLIRWIEAFLNNRKMRVRVRLEFSEWAAVLSGVPQGSVLGPLLFLIFINDLPNWIRNSMIHMFADDTKISRKISVENDSVLLQQDLDSLMNWSKQCHLDFNVDKCKIMRIKHGYQTEYELDGNKIQETGEERDLEVFVTNDLKPSVQCAKAAAKGMQVLGVIKRNFVLTDEEDFRLLFNGFVRPHLEYCVPVWSPYLRKDIECLEKVQRRATKLVKGLQYKSYEERLRLLGITSLEKRRIRGDLIQVFRIVKGFDKVDLESFFELDNGGGHGLRGHQWKLKVKRSRLQLRGGFFSQRVINTWNRMPEGVVEAPSVNSFKIRLDEWSKDVEL